MSKKVIQFLILGLMLIGLPAGSWYYLKSGFNYQKKAFSELMDYGQVPAFDFPAAIGQSVSTAHMADKVVVFGFLQQNKNSSDSLLNLYGRLHDQFHDRDEIQFVLFNLYPEHYTPERLNELATQYELRDSVQIHFLVSDKIAAQRLAANEFKLPDFSQTAEMGVPIPLNTASSTNTDEYPYLILARNGEIKNYYDYRKENSVKRLVEHLALLMPRGQKASPKIVRESEKK